jgi:uncharacterized protein
MPTNLPLFSDFSNGIPAAFEWMNPPPQTSFTGGLKIATGDKTDFWQRTHYGFKRDDGHALLCPVEGDFTLETCVEFAPRHQYDQCGLMIRIDAENWIKVSTEFETATHSRLGSVVTNQGWSDWATQDIGSEFTRMYYRVGAKGADFVLESSYNGEEWRQLRITHLVNAKGLISAGIYACSPIAAGFECTFKYVKLT